MQRTEDSLLGRSARWIVRRLARVFYPRIEVTGGERIPQSGPVLLCANHANSLLDPVLIGIAVCRPVRFLAKVPLFDTPFLGPIMRALGMIPAFRGSDDARQVRKNMESLDTAALALAEGAAMGIFPEGRSHDAAQVEMVRSGTSRIAVKALEAGARDLQVIPMGINYEDKERFRSSVWIQVGEPILMDDWLTSHGGDSRQAMRALTPEIQQRLQSVVVHLDDVQWKPFLDDLEVLVPSRADSQGRSASPVRQRKFIADAMNYFLSHDRPRAEMLGAEIQDYRRDLAVAGLRVDSPVLKQQGWGLVLLLLIQRLWIAALLIPALLGTLTHIVPFTITRLLAERMQAPGKTTVSLSRLTAGIPIYGLWYFGLAWWLYHTLTPLFATVTLVALPFLGVLALHYWGQTWEALLLRWQQGRLFAQSSRLQRLRQRQRELRTSLAALAQEYEDRLPGTQSPPRTLRWQQYRWVPLGAALTLLAGTLLWYFGSALRDRAVVDPEGGVPLVALTPSQFDAELESDERSLRAILNGLNNLEADATAVHADFAAGDRSYANEVDNDAVRQLLLTYLNYRTALLRLIWKHQRYVQVSDERRQLRSFLIGFTSASALFDASTKLVYRFADRPEAVARLNEGDPIWGIPPNTYNTIERNLASRANRELFAAASDYYHRQDERLRARGLGRNSQLAAFHVAIEQSAETLETLGGPAWVSRTAVSAKDATRLLDSVRVPYADSHLDVDR